MNKLMFKFAIAAVVGLGVSALPAQEMGEEIEETAEQAVEDASVNSVVIDAGEAIVAQAAKASENWRISDEIKEMQQAAEIDSKEFISASQIITNKLVELKLVPGYDPQKKTIIIVSSTRAKYRSPARDTDFIAKRNMKALEAYLSAKADIIRTINSDFEGLDRSVTIQEDESAKTPEENAFIEGRKKLEEQQNKLIDLLEEFDKAESIALNNLLLNSKTIDAIEALDRKLSEPVDAQTMTAEIIAKRDAAAVECKELKRQLMALDKAARKLPKKPDNVMTSDIKVTADMPLLGATVITQAESWHPDTKEYEMAVAVVWSAKLQHRAECCLRGDFVADGKPDPKKDMIQDWIAKQDLTVMVGPRRYVDKYGRNLFIGIAAASLDTTVAKQKGMKRQAQLAAVNFVAASLISDVMAYTHAKTHLEEYSNEFTMEESQKFANSLYDEIVQKCSANLQGCVQLTPIEHQHPISGKKIYVVPYYLDPELSAEAKKIMEDSYASAGLATQAMQRRQGVHEGQRRALQQIRDSKEEFNAGVKEGSKGVLDKVNAQKRTTPVKKGSSSKAPAQRGNKGGAYSGDTDIDTDF